MEPRRYVTSMCPDLHSNNVYVQFSDGSTEIYRITDGAPISQDDGITITASVDSANAFNDLILDTVNRISELGIGGILHTNPFENNLVFEWHGDTPILRWEEELKREPDDENMSPSPELLGFLDEMISGEAVF